MAELNHIVDPNDVKKGIEAVPAGEYLAIIEDSDYVENNKGTGMMLKLTYQIIDGPFKGQKIFENLNLRHTSQQTEAIAKQTLNSIGVAVGVSEIKDSAQLHNIPLKIDVRVKESEEYGKQNSIKKYMPANGTVKTTASAPAQGDSKPAASDVKKPWERK